MENRLTALEAELKDLKEKAENGTSWLEPTVVMEPTTDVTVDDFVSSLIERVDSS